MIYTKLMVLLSMVLCVLLSGCGVSSITVTPNYERSEITSNQLKRENVDIVKVVDRRSISSTQIGTAQVGISNTEVPYYLGIPVSDFVKNTLDRLLVVQPQTGQVIPVTVFIDSFLVREDRGFFNEKGYFHCKLRFAYPIGPDAVEQTPISVIRETSNWIDVTDDLEPLIYEGVVECSRIFVETVLDKKTNLYTTLMDSGDINNIIKRMDRLPTPIPKSDPQDTVRTYNQVFFTLSYLKFITPQMKNAYGGAFCPQLEVMLWPGNYLGHQILIGATMSTGRPEVLEPEWEVTTARLGHFNLSLGYSLLLRPTGSNPENKFTPFLGLGGDLIFGIENFTAEVSYPNGFAENKTKSSGLRGVAGLHFLGGMIIPIQENIHLMIESRFMYTSKSGYGDLTTAPELLTEGIYKILRRPDYQFTGLLFCLGLSYKI